MTIPEVDRKWHFHIYTQPEPRCWWPKDEIGSFSFCWISCQTLTQHYPWGRPVVIVRVTQSGVDRRPTDGMYCSGVFTSELLPCTLCRVCARSPWSAWDLLKADGMQDTATCRAQGIRTCNRSHQRTSPRLPSLQSQCPLRTPDFTKESEKLWHWNSLSRRRFRSLYCYSTPNKCRPTFHSIICDNQLAKHWEISKLTTA